MFCSMCGAKAAKTALFCAKCGTKLEALSGASKTEVWAPATPSSTSVDSPTFFPPGQNKPDSAAEAETKRKRNLITVAVAFVVVLIIAGLGIANGGSTNTSSEDSSMSDQTLLDDTTTQDLVPVDWAPAGYTQWDDDLAFKWVTDEHSSDCSDCSWWFIEVVSHYGCPGGVYAELNMLDGDSVVDWSNDTVPSLSSSNSAVLEFVHYPYESQLEGQVVELTCHS